MKLGARAHDYGQHQAEVLAQLLREDQLNAAQVAAPKAITGVESYTRISQEKTDEIRQAFQKNDVEITVLGCYIDLSQKDDSIRNQHIGEFKRALACCKRLEAGMVGTESSYGIVSMEDKIRTWDLVLRGMDELVEEAERLGVRVGIEPVAAHTLYSAEWTAQLLSKIDSKQLVVIFDPINMLTLETINKQDALWKECFDAFGKSIEAIHLKDFKLDEAKQFMPCPLGTGLMGYDYLFQWLHQEKPEISILREEIEMATAKEDIRFMKQLIERI